MRKLPMKLANRLNDFKTCLEAPVSCDRDCGGGCPLMACIIDGRVIKISDNSLGDKHMKGCIKGYRLMDTAYAPHRLKKPLRRVGARGEGRYEEIDWSQALDEIAGQLERLSSTYSSESILPLSGSGSCRAAVHNTMRLGRRFFRLFGGFVDRYDSYSSAAANYTAKHIFGTTDTGIDPETLFNSKLIILWGANPCSARLFSSRLESILAEIKTNGVKIIVIDPRRSRTVQKLADQWIQIRPGTDSGLMAAVLYVLVKDNHLDQSFIEKFTTGFNLLIDYVTGLSDGQPKSPAWAAEICGVPEQDIFKFAELYGSSKPAALIPGLSIQRVLGGEENYRFATALQAATGNIGISGGSSGCATYKLPFAQFPLLPIPEFPKVPSIPVCSWPDMVLQGKKGGFPADIKAIYSIGANYLNQGSDVKKNIRAFQSVDFVVTHDIFMTPTARFSDIVLPATVSLEREDVMLSTENRIFYSTKVIDPPGDSRNDYDILCDLAKRLGFGDEFSEGRTSENWLNYLMDQSEIEDIKKFKENGIFVGKDQERIMFEKFIQNPEDEPLNTTSGRIQIRSEVFTESGFSEIPQVRIYKPDKKYPLIMITPHSRYRINSQNVNLDWSKKLVESRLIMNDQDALKRGLKTGSLAQVKSLEGVMEINVRLDKNVIPGCALLYQGEWTILDKNGVEKAGCANTLASNIPTLPSKGSRSHSVFVEIQKI